MLRGALALALVGTAALAGCNLFATDDSENAAGRGPKAFDPYAGAASGSIRLGLQYYNGCAILATGEPVGKGNANIPYPAVCPRYPLQDKLPPVDPAPPMPLKAGASYFLNQLTLNEGVDGLHTDPGNMVAVTDWMKTQTRFAALDWRNLGIIDDSYNTSEESLGPNIFDHTVSFGNANWQKTDDSFFLEVLDADGKVRQSLRYNHSDFLAENAPAGHTKLEWINGNVGRPKFPGDVEVHAPPDPGVNYPPLGAPSFHSRVRIDLITSTHPSKSFKLDAGLIGDGAIRITWSQMPYDPFYFPVTFIRPQDIPPTCFKPGESTPSVACDFGLQPEIKMVPPQNGKFYVGGETLQFQLAVKDGVGNYLHPPDRLPTYNDYLTNNSNGLLYFNLFHLTGLGERDTITAFEIAGPHQDMRPVYELTDLSTFFLGPLILFNADLMSANAVPGLRDAPLPTSQVVQLPADAKPGTYTAYWKVNRQYMGERFTKDVPLDFQVGQKEKTAFPGRVGNCQICHRGVISLENVRHGDSVDHVEGCKTCHNRTTFSRSQARFAPEVVVHRIHMDSPKFPQQKNNCTLCHLTRESALRPSYIVCSSCHPQPHGTEFWNLSLQTEYDPNAVSVWSNCAEQCHQQTPPTAHILPAQ